MRTSWRTSWDRLATTTTSSPGPPSCQRWKASSLASSSACRMPRPSPRRPASQAVPVAAQGDEVAVQPQDALVAAGLAPVEGDRVVEPAVLEQLLALEQHRDAGRGQDQRRAERRPLLGEPAGRVARADRLGHPDVAVGHLVVRLGVDDPRAGRAASAAIDGRRRARRWSAPRRRRWSGPRARGARSRRPTGRRSRRRPRSVGVTSAGSSWRSSAMVSFQGWRARISSLSQARNDQPSGDAPTAGLPTSPSTVRMYSVESKRRPSQRNSSSQVSALSRRNVRTSPRP